MPPGARGTQNESYPALLATCAVPASPRSSARQKPRSGECCRKTPGSRCAETSVFLGFEVVTALTDVMACLQTWALETYVKVSIPHTGRRQEQRGRAQIPRCPVKGEASFRPKITLHTKQVAAEQQAATPSRISSNLPGFLLGLFILCPTTTEE